MNKTKLFTYLLFATTLLQTSCSLRSNASVIGGNRCTSNRDCYNGTVCDLTLLACVNNTTAQTEVVFAALPPRGVITETAAPTTLAPQTVRSGQVDIQLLPPVVVRGSVTAPGNDNISAPIAASIQFRRQNSTPAEQPLTVLSTIDPLPGRIDSYSAQLVPGVYDISITPTDITNHPTMFLAGQRLESGASANELRLDIAYPTPTLVSGVVRNHAGDPLAGFIVRLVDPNRNRALVSSLCVTGSGPWADSPGAFRVAISPDVEQSTDWRLEVVAPHMASQALGSNSGRLVYQIRRTALSALSDLTITLPENPGFEIANEVCARCVEVEGSVEGTSPLGELTSISQSIIELRADNILPNLPLGHTAWYEAQTQTTTTGSFVVRLPPGDYTATLIPTVEPQFAITSASLLVRGTEPQRGQVLEMRRLIPVTGCVVDGVGTFGSDCATATGQQNNMGGFTVEAIPVGSTLGVSELRSPTDVRARSASIQTDPSGSFGFRLDPGPYRFIVRPPQRSAFATEVLDRTIWVEWIEGADRNPETVDVGPVLLSAPISVSGQVFGSNGTLVGNAVLQAYARIRGSNLLNTALDIELDQVTADASGRYSILLPGRLIR